MNASESVSLLLFNFVPGAVEFTRCKLLTSNTLCQFKTGTAIAFMDLVRRRCGV